MITHECQNMKQYNKGQEGDQNQARGDRFNYSAALDDERNRNFTNSRHQLV